SAISIQIQFQRNVRCRHHSLAAEERQDEVVVARKQGAHLGDPELLEAAADRLQQPAADARKARPGPHADREHPAAARRAEFPVAHLADDEALDAPGGLGDEKEALLPAPSAVAPVDLRPVARLGQPRDGEVDRGYCAEVPRLRIAHPHRGRARFPHCLRLSLRQIKAGVSNRTSVIRYSSTLIRRREVMRRILLGSLAAALFAAAPAIAQEPIRIGAFLSVTGGAAFLGDPEQKTLELYVERVNAAGGVLGRKLQLVSYDSA